MEKVTGRGLAAIMFTDIVGYTALMQRSEEVAAGVRARHRKVFEEQHEIYGGEILQYFGDGTLSIFRSAVRAVECAVSIQLDLQKAKAVPLRVGLHLGDIVYDGVEIYGDSVNLASRIENLGVAGAVLLSERLNKELNNHEQISTISLGSFKLKNIDDAVEIFAVVKEGIVTPHQAQLEGTSVTSTRSIAVLPFVNMSPDPDNEYFSDGITEEIINALSKINNLKVTSRTSSFHFKAKNIPITSIATELNVSHVLEGSVRLAGSRVRITAQLINVAEDSHYWSETFDRSMDDIFAVQDEISVLIAEKLRENSDHFHLDEHLVDVAEVPPMVYQKFLKGRFLVHRMNKVDLEMGMSILKEVTQEAPGFADPYIKINYVYFILGALGVIPIETAVKNGLYYLKRALELKPDSAEVYYLHSGQTLVEEWDFDRSLQYLAKAIEKRPAYADAYQGLSTIYSMVGNMDAALQNINTALRLDPLAPLYHYYKGLTLYLMEAYNQAIEAFKKCLDLDAKFYFSKLLWATALMQTGELEKGKTIINSLPPSGDADLSRIGLLTLAAALERNQDKAREGISLLQDALESDLMGRATMFLIYIFTTLGEEQNALNLIEQAIIKKTTTVLVIFYDPLTKPLRHNARFVKLRERALGTAQNASPLKVKYQKYALKKEDIESHYNRLKKCMDEERPYLNPELSLRQLATAIDIHPNYLSQILNVKIGQNFSTYINTHRLEAFKKRAKESEGKKMTILALAYESGFNSKTVFNTFFKRQMGITPREFWKSV